jgi:hypothetical protein
MCQATHQINSPSANLTFLIAETEHDQTALISVLERIIQICGEWGAMHLLCELELNSPYFETFRHADFKVWAKQHLWNINNQDVVEEKLKYKWHSWNKNDFKGMRILQQSIVPRIFQNLEPLMHREISGLVHTNKDGIVRGYADLVYGPKGVLVFPIIHPESAQDPKILSDMIAALPPFGKKPLAVCVRSYQPWLDELLHQMNAECGPEGALMVKYMAILQKVTNTLDIRVLENGRADTGLPVAHIKNAQTANSTQIEN